MNKNLAVWACTVAMLSLAAASNAWAQAKTNIKIAEGANPESIATLPDGGFLIGSYGLNNVWRAAPGAADAKVWIKSGFIEGGTVTGVFAAGKTAYVCSNGPWGSKLSNLLTFDLSSAAETGRYPLPEGGFCNDMAIGSNGTLYVTDTSKVGRVLALSPGERTLKVVAASEQFPGINGLAFIGDKLYANDYDSGKFYRINTADGSFKELTLSEPLKGPDGMRATADGQSIILAQGGSGKISRITVNGDAASVRTIADGFNSPTSVTTAGDVAFVVEARFGSPSSEATPEMFYAHRVPLDKGAR